MSEVERIVLWFLLGAFIADKLFLLYLAIQPAQQAIRAADSGPTNQD